MNSKFGKIIPAFLLVALFVVLNSCGGGGGGGNGTGGGNNPQLVVNSAPNADAPPLAQDSANPLFSTAKDTASYGGDVTKEFGKFPSQAKTDFTDCDATSSKGEVAEARVSCSNLVMLTLFLKDAGLATVIVDVSGDVGGAAITQTVGFPIAVVPRRPANFIATVSGSGAAATVILSWTESGGADGYRIYRDGGTMPITTVTGGTVAADEPEGAGVYLYAIEAYHDEVAVPSSRAVLSVTVSDSTSGNGLAPRDQAAFFNTMRGKIFRAPGVALSVFSFAYTSETRFEEVEDGQSHAGSYTYTRTDPNTARVEHTYGGDSGDRVVFDFTFIPNAEIRFFSTYTEHDGSSSTSTGIIDLDAKTITPDGGDRDIIRSSCRPGECVAGRAYSPGESCDIYPEGGGDNGGLPFRVTADGKKGVFAFYDEEDALTVNTRISGRTYNFAASTFGREWKITRYANCGESGGGDAGAVSPEGSIVLSWKGRADLDLILFRFGIGQVAKNDGKDNPEEISGIATAGAYCAVVEYYDASSASHDYEIQAAGASEPKTGTVSRGDPFDFWLFTVSDSGAAITNLREGTLGECERIAEGDLVIAESDLVVESPAVSDTTLTPGQLFNLSVAVYNQGARAAAATTLRYYRRSADSGISTSDVSVGADDIDALLVYGTSAGLITLTAPSQEGTLYYGACVAAVPGESVTDNNCSTGVQVVVSPPAVLAPPTGLTATASGSGDTGDVRLNWNSVPGATGYKIYHDAVDGTALTLLHTISGGDTVTWTHLDVGAGAHFYAIAALNTGAADSPQSSPPVSASILQIGVCDRTSQVRDEIVERAPVSDCADVTAAHLAGIRVLDLQNEGISALSAGDFSGLSSLVTLRLDFNDLTSLPADVFSGLGSLDVLDLGSNDLTSLPADVFSGLGSLEGLGLSNNDLTSLSADVFFGLGSLEELNLFNNDLTSLPTDVFSGLGSLEYLYLSSNELTSLPTDVFSGLGSLEGLGLSFNDLTSLPADVFSGLGSLEGLYLYSNDLTSLPVGVFSGLGSLETLDLDGNHVPGGLFNLTLRLARTDAADAAAGPAMVRVELAEGAPFDVVVGLSATGGALAAAEVTIPVGALHSESIAVTYTAGAQISISATPGALPANHRGYRFVAGSRLDLGVAPPLGTPTGLTATPSGSGDAGDVNLNWNSVPDATGYKIYHDTVGGTTLTLLHTISGGETTTWTHLDAGAGAHFYAIAAVNTGAADSAQSSPPVSASILQIGVCDRTQQVRDEIVELSPVSDCADVTAAHLAEIIQFFLRDRGISALSAGDFSGLSSLETLGLENNGLTSLPADVFSGLGGSLETLLLNGNDLRSLSAGVFSGLGSLEGLDLDDNNLASLPAGVFSGLGSLEGLGLGNNDLASLPAGVFSGLGSLEGLDLSGNDLASLPANVFSGLGNLDLLYLGDNPDSGQSLDLTVRLARTDAGDAAAGPARVRVELAEGAPFDVVVGLSATGGNLSAPTATIPAGALHSEGIAVTYTAGARLSISATPGALPAKHSGYRFVAGSRLGLGVLPPPTGLTATASGSGATGDVSLNWDSVPGATGYKIYHDAVDGTALTLLHTISGGETATWTHLDAGAGAHFYAIAALNAGAADSPQSSPPVSASILQIGVCDRTQQVRDKIVELSPVSDCADVTAAHLARIGFFDLSGDGISALSAGDFNGLSSLVTLNLTGNDLTSLPADVFSGLGSLEFLFLPGNDLASLPANVFSGLDSLVVLWLTSNDLTSLPADVFSGLGSLDTLDLYGNDLASLPADVFSGLGSLGGLALSGNNLTSLPAGVFSGLGSLGGLALSGNNLTSLPAGVFSGLGSLDTLYLDDNDLASLPAGVFSGLGSLEYLYLGHNPNGGDSLDLTLRLTRTDAGDAAAGPAMVRVELAEGAPFDVVVGLSATGGALAAAEVTIPVGALHSESIAVTYTAGAQISISATPGALPANHRGYRFVAGPRLGLGVPPPPTGLTATASGSGDTGDVRLNWNSVPGATGYKIYHDAVDGTALTLLHTISGGETATWTHLDAGTGAHFYAIAAVNTGAADSPQSSPPVSASILGTAVCDRTPQVRDEIVRLSPVSDCADVTAAHLAGIRDLDLQSDGISALSAGDFNGLSSLVALAFRNNDLTSLPADVFSGLGSLERLVLPYNDLTSLPAGVFSGLGSLEYLSLGENDLRSLPADVFSGLGSLEHLGLGDNDLRSLPADVFSGLGSLEHLSLRGNDLTELPADVFSGLGSLERLYLYGNDLRALPADVFSGLGGLEYLNLRSNDLRALPADVFSGLGGLDELYLGDNPDSGQSLDLTLRLARTDAGDDGAVGPAMVRVELAEGAPFDVVVGLSATGGTLSAATATIPAGTLHSESVSVTYTAGAQISISATPSIPARHRGYRFVAGPDLGLGANPPPATPDTLATPDGLAAEASGGGASGQVVLTWTAAAGADGYKIYHDTVGGTTLTLLHTISGGDTATWTHLDAGAGTHFYAIAAVKAGAADSDRSSAVSATILGTAVCDRTPQVRDEIVELSPVSDCADVTAAHLAGIREIDLRSGGISALSAGDFSGLSSLVTLILWSNDLTSLPADVFSGLGSLEYLSLSGNDLTSLPVDVFSGLGSLEYLSLSSNDLTSLPADVFSSLGSLERLELDFNDLTSLPAGVFSGLGSLEYLSLGGNDLAPLPADVFSGLGSLEELWLHDNDLAPLPTDVFSGLGSLNSLYLSSNGLTSLPAGVFSGLGSLENLDLYDNDLTSLPADAFSGLGGLHLLDLRSNDLTSLPANVFFGLGSLWELYLRRNPVPGGLFNLTLRLTRTDADDAAAGPAMVRVELAEGAPLDVVVGLSALGGDLSAATATIPAGALHSEEIRVTYTAGAQLSISAIPILSFDYQRGYRFVAGPRLGLGAALLPTGLAATPSGGGASGQVVLTWTAAAGADGYKIYHDTVDGTALTLLHTISDGDTATWTHLNAGEGTHSYAIAAVKAGASDSDRSSAVSASILGTAVCDRTQQVRDKIVRLSPVSDCADVTAAHLAGIGELDLSHDGISALSAGDFSGLSSLVTLNLWNNNLTSLPADVFSGLGSLRSLYLNDNNLTSLPAGVFSGLGRLSWLSLDDNDLVSLPADMFSGLGSLRVLSLDDNDLTSLPADVFSGLGSLDGLVLSSNDLTSLPADVFSGLRLMWLNLGFNDLTSLPADVFSGLGGLDGLWLNDNDLTSLPAGVFSGLGGLERLHLGGNDLTSLPADVFSGLGSLDFLYLGNNLGLTLRLTRTDAAGNDAAAGPAMVRVELAEGAPFDVVVGLSALGGDLSAATATIPAGALHSESVSVTYTAGAQIGISATPSVLPPNHGGYRFVAGPRLGVGAVLPPAGLAAMASGVGASGQVVLTWTAAAGADGHKIYHDTVGGTALTLLHTISDGDTATWTHLDAGEGTHSYAIAAVKAGAADSDRSSAVSASILGTAVCDRTPQVRNAIVELSRVSDCAYVTAAHLAGIRVLDLRDDGISALSAGDFSGLSSLVTLHLRENDLTSLPADVFSGLGSLEWLDLQSNDLASLPADVFSGLDSLEWLGLSFNNDLASLPADVFSGLGSLEGLDLASNGLTSLPADVFSGLGSLRSLSLVGNDLTSLPADVFSGLGSLEGLGLVGNDLTSLPADVFSGLGSLEGLGLSGNDLTSLPAGVFSGLGSLWVLYLGDNPDSGQSLDLTLRLARTDAGDGAAGPAMVRVELAEGAPFDVVVGLSAFGGDLSAATATIPAGALHSEDIRVTYTAGAQIGISATPGVLPPNHGGYRFVAGPRLGVGAVLLPTGLTATPSGVGASGQVVLTWTAAAGATGHKIYHDTVGGTALTLLYTISDGDTATWTHLNAGEGTHSYAIAAVKAGAADSDRSSAVSATILGATVCDRTPQVRDEIVELSPVSDCADVTAAHLAGIRELDLSRDGISALSAGDFSGLSSLVTLDLSLNDLASLPVGVFSGLGSLEMLDLGYNDLTSLPEDVFSGLGSLVDLDFFDNDLTSLPEDVFSGLSSLEVLDLASNDLTSLPEDMFSGLGSLERLNLNSNDLTSLPEDVFSGLDSLVVLGLAFNDLTSLPEDVFSGLGSLETLDLSRNDLASLPEDVFSGLGSLRSLHFHSNNLTSLPEDVFSGLGSLEIMYSGDNDLTSLPEGVFSGLGSLWVLDLGDNPNTGDSLDLTLRLTRTDAGNAAAGPAMVRVELAEGAPSDVVVGLSALGGDFRATATIPAGALHSEDIRVTYTDGAGLDISATPSTRANHDGYRFVAGPRLVLGVAASPAATPTDFTATPTGSGNTGDVNLRWNRATGATGYKIYRGELLITTISSGTTTSYTDNNPGVGAHSYQIAAFNVGGDSDRSDAVEAIIDDDHSNTRSGETRLTAGVPAAGNIEQSGDVDYFSINVPGAGTLTAYTTGNTDTIGKLLDSSGEEIGTNDDGGAGLNFRITRNASGSGTFYIEVSGFSSRTGAYSVQVDFVPQAPDLVVESTAASDTSLTTGQAFTFFASVHNSGSGDAVATTLRYYRSDDSTISSDDDTQVETDGVGALAAGHSGSVSISLNAPSTAGTLYYGACVVEVSDESDTTNNCSTGVSMVVSPPSSNPDLVVESPSVSDTSLTTGQAFTFFASVRNSGSGAAAATTLRYYRSNNSTISSSDAQTGTDVVSALDVGESSSVSISLNAPSTAGTYYYGACITAAPGGEFYTTDNCSTGVEVVVGDG